MVKRILVTGAGGFIGGNVANYLAERDEFNVFGTYHNSKPNLNQKVNLTQTNLLNLEDMNEVVENKEVVIHFASVTGGMGDAKDRINKYITENMIMNSNLFSALYTQKVSQAILPSCSIMYQSSNALLKENDFNPHQEIKGKDYLFAQMKLSLEGIAEGYSREGITDFTVMRHSNIYGPRDCFDENRGHMFGANLGKVMRAKEGESISVWGNGKEERDLLYVNDLSNFVEKAIDNKQQGFTLVNVGSGYSISVEEVVKKIISLSGKNLSIKFDNTKPSKNNKLALDNSKAKELFGWTPETPLGSGIKRTIDWYLSQ